MKEIFGEETKKKKAGIRLVREELFKLVFGVEATESTSEELEKAFDIYLSNNEDFVSTLSESQLKFLQASVKGISENYDNIKDTIKANTQNWAYERIGLVERTLLIIATYEFLKANTPIEVVANETVELAKEYGNEKSYEFVNGILANIGKTK
ncbi:transcription antitermination factor NusB [Fusobacterium pseudoperiodonticum]|jgi:transcription antitermination factor nusB|uniref:Transcription antitermination protein NusB n=1 Tax=Fusobacterium pseudoperiodonticum TaxID=2663009 RepID=A0A2D3PQ33_9FUSO|nr:transcription antitermination factor NusB [Fusobacterium pseudoperiodonticum]ATV69731.1 transcription antitermination factor NusB [Fusobacterium pseudoperiodonticum]